MMKSHVRLALSVVLACSVAGLGACEKKKGEEAEADEPTESAKKQQQDSDKKNEKKKGATEKKPAHSSAIPGTQNQLEWDQEIPEVDFEITSPESGKTLKSGKKIEVDFDLEGYRIGRTIGQHIHFVLDNKPYQAHYEADEPEVFKNVEPGTHTIRAFPSRHYHLSLKKNRPIDTVTFHVENKSKEFSFDSEKPYLTYSRPKGTYSKEAAKDLLLDFYVSNTELGDKHRAVYSVDGEKRGEMKEWKPALLSLKPGEHQINLKLVDSDGKVVKNGGYNDTTRTIKVKK